jgi:hypothetical protein
MTTAGDYSNISELLDTFSKNCVALRYPYEAYDGMTLEDSGDLGRQWLAKGAPDAEATFMYHPEELHGLIFALQAEVNRWLEFARGRVR